MNKYFVEYLGVLVILISKLMTEANPVVMGLVYFSVFTIAGSITTGYFTVFGPLAAYMLNRGTMQDIVYNLVAQFLGAISAILLFKPLTTYIQ